MTTTYDLTIEQGATLYQQFRWLDGDNEPVDLTGYTARMQVRRKKSSDDVLLSATTENGYIELGGDEGTILLNVPAAITAALDFKTGVYDLELVASDGFVDRFLEGSVTLSKEVTR